MDESSSRSTHCPPPTGLDLLNQPLLNKGTAFTEAERDAYQLHGLLPPHVGTLQEQVTRRLRALRAFSTDFQRYAFLRDVQDSNETLFYAVVTQNLEEVLPIIYTPTVGEGCQRLSEIWRKPRGLFLSYPNRHRLRDILRHPRYDRVRVIVVSDGERILGLGDQGAGGMGIPIGKLSLYTACGGIPPEMTLPILLDVGTDNEERLADPLYIGWRHHRVRGAEYDAFVEDFISAVTERWPDVLLQWEDFSGANAKRLLERYRDRLCTFNDDIQGTAAAAAGAILAAIHVTQIPLREQRIVMVGAGSAGCGIASLVIQAMVNEGLTEAEASSRFYAVDRPGLLLDDMPLTEGQRPLAQPRSVVERWNLHLPGHIGLYDVVTHLKPTVLIGVSGQAGAFTERVIRAMAAHTRKPVIFPLSNPTSRSEATPAQLLAWTEGRALIATGSPFPPTIWQGRELPIDQANNSYVFPGLGLGVIASGARRINDAMFMAAAKALADLSPAIIGVRARLLPPVGSLRRLAAEIAYAVARQARADGLAPDGSDEELKTRIREWIWEPAYR